MSNPTELLVKEFHEIHERIFELACRKAKYAPKMSDSLNRAIDTALENEYLTYYGLYREKLEAAVSIELYAIQTKNFKMVPRTWRNWWSFWKLHKNDAAALIEDKIEEDAALYYQELMSHLDDLKAEWSRRRAPEDSSDELTDEPEGQVAEADETPAEAWEEEKDETVPDKSVPSSS